MDGQSGMTCLHPGQRSEEVAVGRVMAWQQRQQAGGARGLQALHYSWVCFSGLKAVQTEEFFPHWSLNIFRVMPYLNS